MAIPHRFGSETPRKRDVSTSPAEAAPEANQELPHDADATAVRAIARYNVERRKAGQPPLDLNGIELMRRILTDTIHRHQVLKHGSDSNDHH